MIVVLILPLLWLLSQGLALAESVAIYSGKFDPPSVSQLRAIRCVLGAVDSQAPCHNLSKEIDRLIIAVHTDANNDTQSSVRERMLMLRRSLAAFGKKVEIEAAEPEAYESRRRRLLEQGKAEKIFEILDAESYGKYKTSRLANEARVIPINFPLAGEVPDYRYSRETATAVSSESQSVIETLGLYQPVNPRLLSLKRALFAEGLRDFLDDLKGACPTAIARVQCTNLASHWKRISVTQEKPSTQPTQVPFEPGLSEDRWAEKYTGSALAPIRGSADYDKLKPVADDIAARTLRGYPRGKVPILRRIAVPEKPVTPPSLREKRHRLSCNAPQGEYNADMDQYVADRFPRAFAKFLKEEKTKRTLQANALYVHNYPVDEAYEYHRRSGFKEFYFIQTRRGQLHRDIHLAVKENPLQYRVVLTSVRGNDRRSNVLCQVDRTGVFSHYTYIESPNPEPLFVLNEEGKALKLTKDDWVLFGFRGSWRRKLAAAGWQRTSLVKEGLDVDVIVHPKVPHKIVTVRNVFGDDSDIVLNTLYKKGARRVLYLGTAGAIENYAIGDAMIPNEFVTRAGSRASFKNNFAFEYEPELAKIVTVHSGITQAWVQSLFEETLKVLHDWKANKVVSVDVEGYHLAQFAHKHKNVKMGAIFIISDQTLGEHTIEETNAYRGLIDAAVDKVVTHLMPKVTGMK